MSAKPPPKPPRTRCNECGEVWPVPGPANKICPKCNKKGRP